MLCTRRLKIVVCSEAHTKHVYTRHGQSVKFVNVERST